MIIRMDAVLCKGRPAHRPPLVFTGPALTWLVLADALAVATVALAELTAHELGPEHVVHALEIRPAQQAEATAQVTHDIAS
jgi:hypothetical protein